MPAPSRPSVVARPPSLRALLAKQGKAQLDFDEGQIQSLRMGVAVLPGLNSCHLQSIYKARSSKA